MDEEGTVLKEEKVENSSGGFEPFFEGFTDAELVIETCYSWRPTYERLEEIGLDVKMAHPKRTEAVAKARKKIFLCGSLYSYVCVVCVAFA